MNIAEDTRETLERQDRLRALGQTASAIAHDIDIALAPIALYTAALLEREPLDERARHYLASIRRATEDVARTVDRLRELDRSHELDAQAADTRRDTAPPFGTRSLRVLLIDDDPSLIEALRTSLADEGHKVSAAKGGQAGIDAFRAAQSAGMPFEVVITDLAMPDVGGRQVVASLRAISPHTPIILLTGWRHQLADGVEKPLNVDRLLGKPPRIRELRTALAELTGRRHGPARMTGD